MGIFSSLSKWKLIIFLAYFSFSFLMELFFPSDLGMIKDFLFGSSRLANEYFRFLVVLKLTIFLLIPVICEGKVELGSYFCGSDLRLEYCLGWDISDLNGLTSSLKSSKPSHS